MYDIFVMYIYKKKEKKTKKKNKKETKQTRKTKQTGPMLKRSSGTPSL